MIERSEFHDGRVILYRGDCLKALDELPENSIESCVTDPPYHLQSIVKRFAKTGRTDKTRTTSGPHQRTARGFMNKQWDGGDIAFNPDTWSKVYRVLKPGAYLLAFAGTRTYHRIACAIEDAGFVIYDQIGWAYGSGFPKSHNIAKAIDARRATNDEIRPWLRSLGSRDEIAAAADVTPRQVDHWLGENTPCPQTLTAPRFISLCEHFNDVPPWATQMYPEHGEIIGKIVHARSGGDDFAKRPGSQSEKREFDLVAPKTDEAKQWEGWGTALKPAWEPICVARKPVEGTIAENVLKWGTGALNIDGCRVSVDPNVDDPRLGGKGDWSSDKMAKNVYSGGYAGIRVGSSEKGRWPANLIHDGSDEVLAAFPDAPGQQQDIDPYAPSQKTGDIYGKMNREGEASASRRYTNDGSTNFSALPGQRRGDKGSAARFFYTAKADADDRLGSKHPTVKPLDLIQYLVRLVTPKGGTTLDPFAGTGTAGEAALREGARAILCEAEPEYQTDIARRMELVNASADTRKVESLKAKGKIEQTDALPLFGGQEAA